MNINELNTLEQLDQLLSGCKAVAFLVASSKDECYRGRQRTLVKQYRDTGKIERQQPSYQGFERLYTADNIRLMGGIIPSVDLPLKSFANVRISSLIKHPTND